MARNTEELNEPDFPPNFPEQQVTPHSNSLNTTSMRFGNIGPNFQPTRVKRRNMFEKPERDLARENPFLVSDFRGLLNADHGKALEKFDDTLYQTLSSFRTKEHLKHVQMGRFSQDLGPINEDSYG